MKPNYFTAGEFIGHDVYEFLDWPRSRDIEVMFAKHSELS
jgi:hypothetical protein